MRPPEHQAEQTREETWVDTERPEKPSDERRQRHARRLLEQCDRLPESSLRLALLREALRVACTCSDESLEYGARLRLAVAARQAGRCTEVLDTIEWCLERHLDDPDTFPAQVAQVDLAVEFAAVPGMLAANSRFSLATIEQSLDELRELLSERANDGRTTVRLGPDVDEFDASRAEASRFFDRARLDVLECTGRWREAGALRAKLARLQAHRYRADHPDDAGTDPDTDTDGSPDAPDHPLLVLASREREIAGSLLPLLDSGQLSDAHLEHLRGYALIADHPKYLRELALHLEFCSESGSYERGLLLVDRHLHWLVADESDERSRFEALVAVAGLLDLVCEVDAVAQGPATPITAADHPDLRAVLPALTTPATAATLADACWSAAFDLAHAFDQRNTTDSFHSRFADAQERTDERCDELAAAQRQRGPSTAPGGSALQRPAAFRMLGSTSALTSAEWLRLARERASVEDPPGALWALQQAHDAFDHEISGAALRPDLSARSLARPNRAASTGRASDDHGPDHHEHIEHHQKRGHREPRDPGARGELRDQRRAGTKGRRPQRSTRAGDGPDHPRFDDLIAGHSATHSAANDGVSAASDGIRPTSRATSDGIRPTSAATDTTDISTRTTLATRTSPGIRPTTADPHPPSIKPALYDLEIRLAVERGDLERAEKLAAWRVDHLIADDRLDLAEVELELGLLLFGVNPERRRGDLERELTYARQNGLEAEAVVSILNALGELRLTQQRPSEAAEFLLSAVALCGHDPDSIQVQRPLSLLAHAQVALEQPEWARATLDRLLRHDLDRAMRAKALLLRASVLQKTGDPRAALDDADRALSLYLELRYRPATVEACATLAALLEELDVHAGVVEAWRMAVTEATATTETALPGHPSSAHRAHPDLLGLQFRLARALISSERGREAVDELNRVFDASATKKPSERAEVLFWLGHAYRTDDDDETAYAVWNLALQLSSEAQDARSTVRTGLALARLLLDNDDDECLHVVRHALALSRLIPDGLTTEVDALHLLAIAQCAFGDREGLSTFDDAIDLAGRHAFDIDALIAAITESRARALDSLGLDDDALTTSFRAARLYERLGDRASAGQAHLFTARLLVTQGRFAEALPVYRRSLDCLPFDAPVVELAAQEWKMIGERVQTAALAASVRPGASELTESVEGGAPASSG